MEPINFNGLDTAVHGPIRLGILSALQIDGALDFTTLKKRLDSADGSMGMHLQKLEDVGYLSGKKQFRGKRPNTTYRITPKGRKALKNHLSKLQELINAVEQGVLV